MNNTSSSSSKKLVIAFIAVLVLAGAAYFYYYGLAPSDSNTLLTAGDPTQQAVGAQVLGLLSQIQTLHIDTALFNDPGYQTLRDHTVPIPEQSVGRSNPFAPVPGMVTAPINQPGH